ncbi:adenine nucleotide transporter BT1, chloroplastic/mitochondrial-like [Euphorbia lathyris]|uniref:adenine nucleotide transporter BT1, chloroplastic/mitochondrial-like n=1 Tax=Euphorbia lathyris TaxID=212925 RepID=UPI0033134CA9
MAINSLQMGRHRNEGVNFSNSGVKLDLFTHQISVRKDVFASVNQVGKGFGISPNSVGNAIHIPASSMQMKAEQTLKLKEFKWKIKVRNQALRRLISGGIAGAVSRTAVAPLETIRTHLMVGSCGHSTTEVFHNIINNDGWRGFFTGNFVNVIRVAPSKAIELFAYDTVLKHLTPKQGEQSKIPIPASSIAGAVAGVSSTLCTYPLELIKTRLTVQRGVYKNFVDAFIKIVREEGAGELYRGLTPSLIGVVPYAAANYFAYDTLRKAYKKGFKKEEIGNVMTLVIGSAAGAISSSATFPLEVARKHMQAGALNGRQYQNMLHALVSIVEKEGVGGLYRGVGPSCMKLIPAAGISFMCYEACKRILIDADEEKL